jgi:hypothetical protein
MVKVFNEFRDLTSNQGMSPWLKGKKSWPPPAAGKQAETCLSTVLRRTVVGREGGRTKPPSRWRMSWRLSRTGRRAWSSPKPSAMRRAKSSTSPMRTWCSPTSSPVKSVTTAGSTGFTPGTPRYRATREYTG